MILGLGNDLIDIRRIEKAIARHGERFLSRIYTDIERDGAMGGPNIDATVMLARATRTKVIASGGVSSMADLERLRG